MNTETVLLNVKLAHICMGHHYMRKCLATLDNSAGLFKDSRPNKHSMKQYVIVLLEVFVMGIVSKISRTRNSIWPSSRENLSSGFPSKRFSNQSPQLHRLSRNVKFRL